MYCMAGSIGDLDPSKAPLVLRRVSPVWKAIADSMPRLWSMITVTPPQLLLPNVQVIREWLERSGRTCLDISIHAPVSFPDYNLVAAILAEFMPSCRRWQHLALFVPVEFLPMLLSNPSAPLPALESLKLAMDQQPHFTIDRSAARLRSVSLLALSSLGFLNGSDLNLAWDKVTHLDIKTTTGAIDVIWDIFFQCPNLFSLTIIAANNPYIPKIPFRRGRVFHSNIRQLTMYVSAHPAVIGYFLDGLYLPLLQELRLCFTDLGYEPYLWPKMAILDLRERCRPPLSKVAIAGKTIFEADFVDFVQRMKHLDELDVAHETHDLVTHVVRDVVPPDDGADSTNSPH
jgi:hypothetical protein